MELSDCGFLAIAVILAYWVFQLKGEVRRLSDEAAHKPPETPSFTVRDMQMIQSSLSELVDEIEQYTESQLSKMTLQTQTLQVLCKRLEEKIQDQKGKETMEEKTIPVASSTRVVPLNPKQNLSNHKDRDRIIELHKKGWTADRIAEELRITKGEVQLVVNLA